MRSDLWILRCFAVLVVMLAGEQLCFAQGEPEDGEATDAGPQQVGVVFDTTREGRKRFLSIEAELEKFVGKGKVTFPQEKMLSGDGSLATARRNLNRLLQDPEVDVVWAFGMLASQAALERRVVEKPTLAPFVLDASLKQVSQDAIPANLSYIRLSLDLERDLKTFRDIGTFNHVAILASSSFLELPGVEAHVQSVGKKLSLKLTLVKAGGEVAAALAAIPDDVEAVYLGPTTELEPGQVSALAKGLVRRKLPSFSMLGRLHVQRGILAGLGSPEDGRALVRQIVVNTDAILRGEQPNRLRTVFRMREKLVINLATARSIGLEVPWEILSEAEPLNAKKKSVSRRLTLDQAVSEVKRRNFDLLTNERDLYIAKQGVVEARAALLPRLDASVTGNWIDTDRAGVSNPELQASWATSLSQTLFNESTLSSLSVQKHLRDATRYGNASATLDAVHATAVAYLNVLATQTAERIQRDNLKTTRVHLELARTRVRVGSAGRSEVVRLESELVSARRNLVAAVATRNIAEMELNRLLARPLDEPYELADVELEDSGLFGYSIALHPYLEKTDRLSVLGDVLVREGLKRAPELRSLTAQAAAKARQEKSYRRAPFLPNVSLSASFSHRFAEGGKGANAEVPAATSLPDDYNLSASVTASLPLFEGGARYARRKTATAERHQLGLQTKATRDIIEQNIRTALFDASASLRSIRLSRETAELSRENLELVESEYGSGKATIIQLLDAQNEALVSEQSASTAVYEFLIDLMALERATGRFEFEMTATERDAFVERLEQNYARRNGK